MKPRGALWRLLLQEFSLPQPLVVEAQAQPDPEFPTVVFPNPEEGEGTWQMAFDTGGRTRTVLLAGNSGAVCRWWGGHETVLVPSL